jgi:hypothetical protein
VFRGHTLLDTVQKLLLEPALSDFLRADTERRPSLAVGSASRLPPPPSMGVRRRPERDEGRAAASPVRSFLFF